MARRNDTTVLRAPIISTISNQIPTKEVLLRLQKIADTLSAVDQNEASLDDYRLLSEDLSNKKLLFHKNIGIQAFTCCAITDILRIFAPDAPFPPETLSAIFKAFFNQLSHLWDEENAYYQQQCYVLKRIVEVRSVVLMADLPDSEKLTIQMFETMYSLAGKGLPSRLAPLAAEMLSETISEADAVPQPVVSLLLKKLIVPANYPVARAESNISNVAFLLSLSVCEANVDKMARHVAQHFSEMLDASVSQTKTRGSDVNTSYTALEKIHSSSVYIWTHIPELLSSVMGLIGDELNSDSEKIRLLATTSIGSMLSSSSSTVGGSSTTRFVNAHKTAWSNWLKKSSDISATVRDGWVQQVAPILSSQTLTTEVLHELCSGLLKCLMDSSEKVRLVTCKSIRSLPIVTFVNKLCTEDTISSFILLCREKHVDIRNEAISFLAELYNYFMDRKILQKVIDFGRLEDTAIENVEKLIMTSIPNSIMQLIYVNDKLLTATVDIVLFEQLIPFIDDPVIRVSRFCSLYQCLDSRSRLAFTAINNRQKKSMEVLLKFVDYAEEYALDNSLQTENKENVAADIKERRDRLLSDTQKIIHWLVTSFPGGIHSYECIDRFFRLRNLRLINLLKNSINSQLDYKSVKNSIKEILLKVADDKVLKLESEPLRISTTDMISNLKLLLYRSSFILYNKTNVGQVIKFCTDTNSQYHEASNELITEISNIFPASFRFHSRTLVDIIIKCEDPKKTTALLRALYHYGKKLPDHLPTDNIYTDFFCKLAMEGSSSHAKYAIKILGCYNKEAAEALAEKILPFDSETSATKICTVAELFKLDSLHLMKEWNSISSFVIDEVLRKNDLKANERGTALEWIQYEEISEYPGIDMKLSALRLLLNKVRFDSGESLVTDKVIKLFCAIISNNGEIVKASNIQPTPNCYKAHLRLAAGLGILKLAQIPAVNATINFEVITKLSRLLYDKNIEVRRRILGALKKRLSKTAISERFLHLVFLLGHDPDKELMNDVVKWVLSQHAKAALNNDIHFESSLVRLAFGVARNEMFKKHFAADNRDQSDEQELEAYIYALRFVRIYLDSVAKESNISLLYYFASRIKQCKTANNLASATDPITENLNLYRVAELFQLMIKEYSDVKGWSLQTWPGKLNLPSDLYTPIDDFEEALKVISKIYILDEVQVELRNWLDKPGTSKRKPVQKLAQTAPKKKRNRKRERSDDDLEPVVALERAPRRVSTRVRKKVVYEEANEVDHSESSNNDDSDFE